MSKFSRESKKNAINVLFWEQKGCQNPMINANNFAVRSMKLSILMRSFTCLFISELTWSTEYHPQTSLSYSDRNRIKNKFGESPPIRYQVYWSCLPLLANKSVINFTKLSSPFRSWSFKSPYTLHCPDKICDSSSLDTFLKETPKLD